MGLVLLEMAKSFISKKKNKNIYTHSFETNLKSPIQNLLLQSIPLKKCLKMQLIEQIEGYIYYN